MLGSPQPLSLLHPSFSGGLQGPGNWLREGFPEGGDSGSLWTHGRVWGRLRTEDTCGSQGGKVIEPATQKDL